MPTVSVAGVTRASIATQPLNAQTGTEYTVAATDIGKVVTLTNGSAITLYLPADVDATIPVGATVDFLQLGAGLVTYAGGAGATVNGTPGLASAGQYAGVSATKVAADTWVVTGALSA
jgi:hypothetical protein